MLPRMRTAFRWLTSVLFVAIVVQVGFAGYGAFDVIHKAEQASVSVPKKTIEDAFNAHSALGPIIVLLMLVLLIGYALMAISAALHLNPNQPKLDWGAARWIFPYLIGITVISYFGSFGGGGVLGNLGVFSDKWIGGQGDLPIWWDLLVLAVFSLGIYYLAVHSRLPKEQVDKYVADVYPPPVA